MKNIKLFLTDFRKKYTNLNVIKNLSKVLILSILAFTALCILEEIFYFSSLNRKIYFTFYISIVSILLIYNLIFWIISYFSLFHNSSNEK